MPLVASFDSHDPCYCSHFISTEAKVHRWHHMKEVPSHAGPFQHWIQWLLFWFQGMASLWSSAGRVSGSHVQLSPGMSFKVSVAGYNKHKGTSEWIRVPQGQAATYSSLLGLRKTLMALAMAAVLLGSIEIFFYRAPIATAGAPLLSYHYMGFLCCLSLQQSLVPEKHPFLVHNLGFVSKFDFYLIWEYRYGCSREISPSCHETLHVPIGHKTYPNPETPGIETISTSWKTTRSCLCLLYEDSWPHKQLRVS